MPEENNSVTAQLNQIRSRGTSTLVDLEEIKQNSDKNIYPELDAIRRATLTIISNLEEIAYKQYGRPSDQEE